MPMGQLTADQLQCGYWAYPQYISQEGEGIGEGEIDRQTRGEQERYGKILSGLRQQNLNTYSAAKGNVWIVLKVLVLHTYTWEKKRDTFINLQTYFIFSAPYLRTGLWFDRGGDTLWKGSEYDRGVSYTASALPLFESAACNSSTSQEFNTL